MGKYSVYAVSQGVDPVDGHNVFDMKFYTWTECMPYVKGARFCKYKGFGSEAEADAWLAHEREKRHAYPALAAMESSRHKESYAQPSTRFDAKRALNDSMIEDSGPYEDTISRPVATIAGIAKGKSKPIKSDDIKFKFSSKCMDLGLDPNDVLIHLMKQWLETAEMIKINQSVDPDEDDEPPW